MRNMNMSFTKSLLPMIMWASLALMACGKGNSNDGGPSTVHPNPWNCPTCHNSGISSVLLPGVRSATPGEGVLLTLDVRIQDYPQYFGSCPQPYEKRAYCYNGPGTLVGVLRIVNPNEICGAPPGDYNVTPIQIGSLSNLILRGGTFEAVGPARILLSLNNGILYNPGGVASNSPNNRISLSMALQSVNGVPCGTLSTQ